MPIAATLPALQVQIADAFRLDRAATPDTKALAITSAVASIAPSGLYPPSPTPAPLIPSGFSACQAQLKNAFSLDRAATPETVGKAFAIAISILVPTVPATGQSLLGIQIADAFNLGRNATPDIVGSLVASAIITYYSSAGVL
jgi:hypothetical protein